MDCLECLCRKGVYDKESWIFTGGVSYSQFFVLDSTEQHMLGMQRELERVEALGIIPCVTAWCCHCKRVKALCRPDFPHYRAALEDLLMRQRVVETILNAK